MSLTVNDLCNLKIGDIVYEFYGGRGVKSEVITSPGVDEHNVSFITRIVGTTTEIHYNIDLARGWQYIKLYDHRAYEGCFVEGED